MLAQKEVKPQKKQPSIGLVLGGGGARGLVHIHAIEAFDELGITPEIIAGTSIGAIFGAAYASGMSGAEIRDLAMHKLGKRTRILKNLFGHKLEHLLQLWNFSALSKSLMKPEALLGKVLPEKLNCDFADLEIPLKLVATDFYKQDQVILDSGPLLKAVAASMAIPAVFQPVIINNRVLIDGGMTNPLPFDILENKADIIIAIDVTGGPVCRGEPILPTSTNALFAASQIQQNTIVREKLKRHKPNILLNPPVNGYQVLAFHKIKEILAETEGMKDQLKRAIDAEFTKHAALERMI